jgi:putative flippase GtrA
VSLLKFAAVGTLGYLADVSILLAGVRGLHLAPVPARIFSFICAASLTYHLNRRFTFGRSTGSLGRWLTYLAATASGAVINILIYRAWLLHAGTDSLDLVVGSALGSVAALFFNYFASAALAFPKPEHVK